MNQALSSGVLELQYNTSNTYELLNNTVSIKTIYYWMVRWLMNDKFKWIWKDVHMV
jgi:hypothetical protein